MRLAAITGWLLALGAAGAAGIMYWEYRNAVSELQIARDGVDIVKKEAHALKRLNNQLELEVQALKEQQEQQQETPASAGLDAAALLKGLLGNLEGEEAGKDNPFAALAGQDSEDDATGEAFGKLFGSIFGDMTEGEDGADPFANIGKAMGDLFASEAGRNFLSSMSETILMQQYGDLFKELKLSPETEARVKEIYMAEMDKGMEAGLGMLSGDVDFEALQDLSEQNDERLKQELAKVLTPPQMERLARYEEELPRRIMSDTYKRSLGVMVPGLSPGEVDTVAEVLVEESVALENGADSIEGYLQLEAESFDRALARLAPQLSEEQFRQLETFLESQRQSKQAALEIIKNSGGFPAAEEEPFHVEDDSLPAPQAIEMPK
jgi:hypothetical protein